MNRLTGDYMEEEINFDQEIRNILEQTFQAALAVGKNKYTSEQIKLMIVASNMHALAKTFLEADENPNGVSLNLKKVALGILGTSDWIEESFKNNV
jgi:hypothetical protein